MKLGTVEGEVDTTSFEFRAVEEVRKFDFVSVKSHDRWILCQVDEVTKKPEGETLAHASIIGYRDKGLTRAPRTVIEPDSIVYEADQDLISETLGLEDAGLNIGTLETDDEIEIFVDQEDFYKHFSVIGQTGSGKSYATAVLIEEMLEQELPVLVIDPHGEYSSLGEPNPESDTPASYPVEEYSPNTAVNSEAMPLSFSEAEMERDEIMDVVPDSLSSSQMGVLYNAEKRLGHGYSLEELMDSVRKEDSSARWNLLNSLEQLKDTELFSESPTELEKLVEPGTASVVNLKAVEPEAAEITVYSLAKRLFDMRKRDLVPPFIMVIEEAHNYAPEQSFGKALSNDILRKIASEGRKFGLGIGVISQRPARIDKNVLSQANTQFILRVTNPNDLKAISKSFEGVTSEVESMIKSLPPGISFVLGNEYPVMTNVRKRRSRHGGTTETGEGFVEKTGISAFVPRVDKEDVENQEEIKLDEVYRPLFLCEGSDARYLVDAKSLEVRAEQQKLNDREQKVLELLKQNGDRQQVADETNLQLQKVNRIVQQIRDKNRMQKDAFEEPETVFSLDSEELRVAEESVQEKSYGREEVVDRMEVDSAELVHYPYYASDDTVFDPVAGKKV